MKSLGIDIGSTSIKMVCLEDDKIKWQEVISHEGSVRETLKDILERYGVEKGTYSVATGGETRHLLNIRDIVLPLAIEKALEKKNLIPKAIISLGGEDFSVYTIDKNGRVEHNFASDKCASGTGEFLKQQLLRMDMSLDDIKNVNPEGKVHKLSSRCSVFMKSDCTHKLNKKEATPDEIVLSLSMVMAQKAREFLMRAKVKTGEVLIIGGVTHNQFLVKYLSEILPKINFLSLPESPYFEALGASILAASDGTPLPDKDDLFSFTEDDSNRYRNLTESSDLVDFISSKRGKIKVGGNYIMGVDGGSTTTKVALVDIETDEIVAAHYGRTHGDPVKAINICLRKIKEEIQNQLGSSGQEKINIKMISTTGSSREILGVYLETQAVYNEIIAHTVGTTFYNDKIDTIFEIGGQDAKYVYLKNNVPIDYAMNEACSAGTGSFLEESAAGDLSIQSAHLIGDIASRSESPLKFGEHCSAFINSDIRKAIQNDSKKEDIVGGIVFSIVSNYLNRVVGNRMVGNTIVLQGGVAKNKAVPLAFASFLNKKIIVPPEPELMGCFGVALLAKQKIRESEINESDYFIDSLLENRINYGKVFRCRSCENDCPIKTIIVNEHKYFFGGRCDKYANIRKKKKIDIDSIENLVSLYNEMIFTRFAPKKEDFLPRIPRTRNTNRQPGTHLTVAITKTFTVYSMWPLYSWFFHELGVEVKLTDKISPRGQEHIEAPFCYPAEIAHGMVSQMLADELGNDYQFISENTDPEYSGTNVKFDYYFAPQVKFLSSYEDDNHATLCPIVQAFPYYMASSFPLDKSKILKPVIDFKNGFENSETTFGELAEEIGFTTADGQKAFRVALEKYHAFRKESLEIGRRVISEARKTGETIIVLLGRPYNTLTDDANMGIPRKFISRGIQVLPNIFMPVSNEEITDNMYWYWGQVNLKSTVLCKQNSNLFPVYITNFSCAPDSFLLHQARWIMGSKPFLVLELDSHTADAGVDTRIEAFLDIIHGYKKKMAGISDNRKSKRLKVVLNNEKTHFIDTKTNEKIKLTDKRVTLFIPSMGSMATDAVTAAIRSKGVNAVSFPVPTHRSTQLARDVASGKECIPTLLTLGSTLQYFYDNPPEKDKYYLVFIPSTTGPCRTGQYGPFFDRVFETLEYDNVTTLPLCSDNSYNELGAGISKYVWWGLTVSDVFKDIETSLEILAKNPDTALARFREIWEDIRVSFGKKPKHILQAVKNASEEIKKIPIEGSVHDLKKILIVGEIYVRRDDFSQKELLEMFRSKRIMGKITGITEWINYTTHIREMILTKQIEALPVLKRIFSKEYREFQLLKIEKWYKHKVETDVFDALYTTSLVPRVPYDMDSMMSKAQDFTDKEFETEVTISSISADEAIRFGYSGVVIIAPFACLIGRLLKSVLTPYMRKKGYPIITIENDGHTYPPNVRNQIEIFMLNALRFVHDKEKESDKSSENKKDNKGNGKTYNREGDIKKSQNLSYKPIVHVSDSSKKA